MKYKNVKLGSVARDTITGFTGVLVGKTEWLNGCVRLTIQPKELHEGKPVETITFDVEQVEIVEEAKPKARKSSGGPMPSVSRY